MVCGVWDVSRGVGKRWVGLVCVAFGVEETVAVVDGNIIEPTISHLFDIAVWYGGLLLISLLPLASPRDCAQSVLWATLEWWKALVGYMSGGRLEDGGFEEAPSVLKSEDESDVTPIRDWTRRARVHTFALALVWRLWDKKHYRNGTFADDVRKNLRNCALPGTGVPLSYFAASKELFLGSAMLLGPVASAIAGVWLAWEEEKKRVSGGRIAWSWERVVKEASRRYVTELVAPTTWYALWRLNCSLATYHASVTNEDGYRFEDKEAFLEEARRVNLPTTPTFRLTGLIAKHRNEEGGLGFGSFRSATAGGDWIVQPWLNNHACITPLLPADAPLSTLRIVTMRDESGDIRALSCVWRAGRSGATTDHSSILFDMNFETGKIGFGGTNEHWYKLGPSAIVTTPFSLPRDATTHPDSHKQLTGVTLPRIADAAKLCERAHQAMAPRVTFIGWDVALTETPKVGLEGFLDEDDEVKADEGREDIETVSASLSVSDSGDEDDHGSDDGIRRRRHHDTTHPTTTTTTTTHPATSPLSSPRSSSTQPQLCLLEANFSCNFFRATFDEASYYKTVESNFLDIHAMERGEDEKVV